MPVDDLLVCGVCHGTLKDAQGSEGLVCTGCGREYRRRDGVPDLTPVPPPDEVLRSKWSLWEALQANGEVSYREEADSSLSVGDREDAARFAAFCALAGTVLDVGCGPQARPSYAGADRFVGIDPLRGETRREFDFVQGIGEYLPFGDHSFDHVLFATSLDHLLDPVRALRDAARVLKPGGTIEIWSGEVAPPPGLGARIGAALGMLRRGEVAALADSARSRLRPAAETQGTYVVPEGAADAFHLFHPTRQAVDGMVSEAGLAVLELESPDPGQRFLRVAPAAARS
jgi:SAM-dependent methyltransferase